MQDPLRDPIWQFWGAVIGVISTLVATAVAIAVVWYQRSKKNLSYEVLSAIPLYTVAGDLEGRVQVFVDGQPVESPRVLVLKIYNSGNVPIVPTDYVRPVSVVFPNPTRPVGAEVMATVPENLGVSLTTNDRTVNMDQILLNKGDSVTMKLILAQSTGEFSVNGRIVGVRHIAERKASFWKSPWAAGAIFFLGLFAAVVINWIGGRLASASLDLISSVVASVVVVLFVTIILLVGKDILRAFRD